MKPLFRAAAAAAVLLCCVRAQQTEAPERIFSLSISSVELGNVSSDRASVRVGLRIECKRKVTIQGVTLQGLRVNGVPVHVPALSRKIELEQGKPVDVDPFEVELYYRSLESLEPLQRAVAQGSAQVDGSARILVDLNWLGKIALWARDGVVLLPVSQQMPVHVPGGALGRRAASLALRLAEPGWSATGAVRKRTADREWRERASSTYTPSLAVVRNRFKLTRRKKDTTEIEVTGIAIYLGGRILSLPHELIEPWRYDTALLAGFSTGAITLEGSREIEVIVAGAVFSSSHRQVEVAESKCKEETAVVVGSDRKPHRVKACVRNHPDSIAFLRLAKEPGGLKPIGPPSPFPAATTDLAELSLFRLRGVDNAGNPEWEFTTLAGSADGSRIELREPADSDMFGSPVLVPDGWIGVLQDERHAAAGAELVQKSKSAGRNP